MRPRANRPALEDVRLHTLGRRGAVADLGRNGIGCLPVLASDGQNVVMDRTIFEAAGGDPAFLDLAQAWHRRALQDPVVSHAFSHPGQHPQHVERLAAYWAEMLGGPTLYSDTIGDHSHVLRLHSGNGEHEDMDTRAQTCFALALDDAGLPHDERLRSTLKDWFRWATTAMAAYPRSADEVPFAASLPRWSWDGPVHP